MAKGAPRTIVAGRDPIGALQSAIDPSHWQERKSLAFDDYLTTYSLSREKLGCLNKQGIWPPEP